MTELLTPPKLPKPGLRSWWGGLNVSSAALAISQSLRGKNKNALLVAPTLAEAERIKTALNAIQPNLPVQMFPDWETLPYDNFSPHPDIVSDRLRCLYDLSSGDASCVIVSAQTLLQRLPPLDYVRGRSLVLRKNQKLSRDSFCDNLQHAGYVRVDTVFQHSEYALRGSLIDVFPMGSDASYRIELFDDEVDSIRTFDPETQRTVTLVDAIELLPARECPLDDKAIATFRENWHRAFDVDHRRCQVYQDVSGGIPPAGIEYFLPLFFNDTASFFDYLPTDTQIFCFEGLENALENYWRDLLDRYDTRSGDLTRPLLKPDAVYFKVGDIFSRLKKYPRVDISRGAIADRAGAHDFPTPAFPTLSIDARAAAPLQQLQRFLDSTPHRILFCAESEGRREVIKELLHKISLHPVEFDSFDAFIESEDKTAIAVAALEEGIFSERDNFIAIAESMLFGERVRQKRQRNKVFDEGEGIVKNLAELKIDSAVVHIEHGVGRYRGLQVIEHGGIADEFLVLEYADKAKLYVPVTNLYLISRYSAADEAIAPLHKLGSDQWQKAKRKAAEKVRDVAAELLHIYALRQAREGFKHQLAEDAYEKFASEFPFEETVDQSSAIASVRADMLDSKPMDRLICGDVGFGKTEVAMRAAFIAVHNSKQVVVLVPTTLLAQQHLDNFKDRFAHWPVNIDVLSRFRSAKESGELKKRISSGKVDIVIGTHALLSGDVKFKNLGLVIIDEEHRFGVRQKEALKALRTEVDILTLTATPIPRTLNMSMSGMRDLSIISTPPARRLSVKTFVRENDKGLIKEAITREIMRGGQVYYLHNEVVSIEKTANDLQALIPEARIKIGHGQMRERELESVMSDFYHKRFNILVCTTIIETGIDVPSANTIIIDRADKFGLAQLHQLRGRVGRSHHQAYAYLLIPHRKSLGDDAEKRLLAIEEAQDLGAGFTLASHDLEIRGAGELLGDEQSGQIQSVGFTLYMDMLERAVNAIKSGKEFDLEAPFEQDVDIKINIPALIPDSYLPDVNLRLSLYKRLASTRDDTELERLQVEMIDRFGLLPNPVKYLFRQTRLRHLGKDLGVTKIEANKERGKLEFARETKVEPLTIVKLVQTQPQRYKLSGANQLQFAFDSDTADARFDTIENLLQSLRKK